MGNIYKKDAEITFLRSYTKRFRLLFVSLLQDLYDH